jgi:hypothetical protein
MWFPSSDSPLWPTVQFIALCLLFFFVNYFSATKFSLDDWIRIISLIVGTGTIKGLLFAGKKQADK